MAGYSSRPLRDKLGIRPAARVALLQAPPGYLAQLWPLPLAHGLVDVKVCAVDEVWSGLKLVVRLRDR